MVLSNLVRDNVEGEAIEEGPHQASDTAMTRTRRKKRIDWAIASCSVPEEEDRAG
jgi:hypothetical protein